MNDHTMNDHTSAPQQGGHKFHLRFMETPGRKCKGI
jgi:hypothetical protein